MGFLIPDPVRRGHFCKTPRPATDWVEGTRWQCDDCLKIYRVEYVMDRNIMALEWVHQK